MMWKGYSNKERNEAIYEIESIINKHGYILDFKPFSDMEISFVIEIEERKMAMLYTELRAYLTMNEVEFDTPTSGKEITLLLNVTFLKSTGDHTNEIPDVPG